MPRSLAVNGQIQIPGREMRLTFARSSGPGGQNVNKVNSKAVLRWNVAQTPSLPNDVKQRFLERFSQRISVGGEILLTSDRHRDQPRNVAECYQRLRQLILSVAVPPRQRRKSHPTRSSVERRLQNKKRIAQRKKQRRERPDRDS